MPSLELFTKLFLVPFIVSTLLAYAATYFVRLLYLRFHWLDDPSLQRHPKVIHTYPIPRGGGLAIFTGFFLSTVYFLGIDKHSLGILLGGLLLAVVGFLDDRKDLNPYLRLILGFVAASFVVAAGIGIAFITNPVGEGVLYLDRPQISFSLFSLQHTIWVVSDLFALIWIVWSMNMVNWSMGSRNFSGHHRRIIFRIFTVEFLSPKDHARLWRGGAGRLPLGDFGDSFGSKNRNGDFGTRNSNYGCRLYHPAQDRERQITRLGRSRPFPPSSPGSGVEQTSS